MPSISEDVRQAIADAERGTAPGVGRGFTSRAAAIDALDVRVLDRLQALEEQGSLLVELRALRAQAAALRGRLEAANDRVVRRLRRRIVAGRYTPEGLGRAFSRCIQAPLDEDSYDALDLLVGGLLGDAAGPEPRAAREPEMVAYQPTPARMILSLIAQAKLRPDDVFFDVGSGLGQVVILVALLSGARARGIEFDPAYCEYAAQSARRLNLRGVEFIHADAREASLVEGTVFFMYTPFRGALLQQVLERLRAEARKRPIRVCTYGPCTAEVAGASWLRPAEPDALGERAVAVFYSQ